MEHKGNKNKSIIKEKRNKEKRVEEAKKEARKGKQTNKQINNERWNKTQCTYEIGARSRNHWCSGKAMSITMFWVCVCSLRYPACYAHAPYCHLWPALLYSISPHYLIHVMIFGKKKFFSTTFVWNISHYKKNWARYYKKCILVGVWSTGYSSSILMKLEFSRQTFEKYSNFMKIRPVEAEVSHADGRTDGQTWRS